MLRSRSKYCLPVLGVAVVLILGTGTLTVTGLFGQTTNQRTGLPIDALSQTVWVEEFDVSPDGSLIAFKSAKAGTYDIWTISTDGGAPRQLTRASGREMAPKFSPDGR